MEIQVRLQLLGGVGVLVAAGCVATPAQEPAATATPEPVSAPTVNAAETATPDPTPAPTVAPTPPPTPTAPPTPQPTPTPLILSSADIHITAGELTLSYEVDTCPLAPGMNFGIYPAGVEASDGTQWSTQMVVLGVTGGELVDWSFILTTPPGVPSAQNDERLTSAAGFMGVTMSADYSETGVVFTTNFHDMHNPLANPAMPGRVEISCR